ncbi:hypothetical protein [Actinoplanes sp. NPDC026619]|uniref:hypothetical protein n=1 Tax=Actinoplanes sp. NPDC026619 TaxID=3155798 RepID=UPI0034013E3F
MPRSRPHHNDDDPPDDGGGPHSHPSGGGGGLGSVARFQELTLSEIKKGQIGGVREAAAPAIGGPPQTRPQTPDDIELSLWEDQHAKLDNDPPRFNMAANDAAHAAHQHHNAHTLDRHGPDIPLRLDPSRKTIEGRIYNGTDWHGAATASLKWTDHTTMHRVINDYVAENWTRIRNDLAIDGLHRDVFDARQKIGEGFVNRGMYGAGPPQAQYTVTSTVRITIRVAPGTDPPQPYIVTAFPTALG